MTLFQIITLEGWIDLMHEQITRSGKVAIPILYFVTFILIGTMVMLNLLIGVIVNGMDEARLFNSAPLAQENTPPPRNPRSALNAPAGAVAAQPPAAASHSGLSRPNRRRFERDGAFGGLSHATTKGRTAQTGIAPPRSKIPDLLPKRTQSAQFISNDDPPSPSPRA